MEARALATTATISIDEERRADARRRMERLLSVARDLTADEQIELIRLSHQLTIGGPLVPLSRADYRGDSAD